MQRRTNRSAPAATWMRTARSRGVVLVASLIVGVLILGLMMASMTVAQATSKWLQHLLEQTEALSLAEAATELRQKALITEIANFAKEDVLTEPRTHALGKGGKPQTVISRVRRIGAGGAAATDDLKTTDSDGVVSFVSYFQITARAVTGTSAIEVMRTVQVGKNPVFQYGVFYDDDLEILPGPDMTLAGRIHANGDIYLNGGATLRINSAYLRCTGEIYREAKRAGEGTKGTTLILQRGSTTFAPMEADNAPAARWVGSKVSPEYYGNFDGDPHQWVAYADATWQGTVKTQAHGTKEVASPQIKTITPGGYYHNEAGLVIEYAGNGVNVYARRDGAVSAVTSVLPAGTVALGTIYDGRQKKNLNTIEVDMAKLRDAGVMPDNGLVYAYRADTTEETPHGVVFKNGKELSGATMLVSPGPVYIQGDFNCPEAASSYAKQPSMLICDAVNLLSNAWDNTKTAASGVPRAGATTVNLAMASGIVRTPDTGGDYSGGLENFPRFHENWTGVTLRIRGSFMALFASMYATGPWKNATYGAPTRDWGFDPDLLNGGNAFAREIMPWAVSMRRVAWQDNVESVLD